MRRMLHIMRRLIHHLRSPKRDVVQDHNPRLRQIIRIRRIIIRLGRDRRGVDPRTEHPPALGALHVVRPLEDAAHVAVLAQAGRRVRRGLGDPACASCAVEHQLGVPDEIAWDGWGVNNERSDWRMTDL